MLINHLFHKIHRKDNFSACAAEYKVELFEIRSLLNGQMAQQKINVNHQHKQVDNPQSWCCFCAELKHC